MHVPGNARLGLRIRGGTEFGIGVFVSSVDRNQVAERAGIRVSSGNVLLLIGRALVGNSDNKVVGKCSKTSSLFLFSARTYLGQYSAKA